MQRHCGGNFEILSTHSVYYCYRRSAPFYSSFAFQALQSFCEKEESRLEIEQFREMEGANQSCKKITILDLKDQDLFIDLDLLYDLDQYIDHLKLIFIFDLQNWRSFCNHFQC